MQTTLARILSALPRESRIACSLLAIRLGEMEQPPEGQAVKSAVAWGETPGLLPPGPRSCSLPNYALGRNRGVFQNQERFRLHLFK